MERYHTNPGCPASFEKLEDPEMFLPPRQLSAELRGGCSPGEGRVGVGYHRCCHSLLTPVAHVTCPLGLCFVLSFLKVGKVFL